MKSNFIAALLALGCEGLDALVNEAGTAVYQSCIQLNELRTRAYFFLGIVTRQDAAHPNNGNLIVELGM